MIARSVLVPTLMAASVGVPYAVTNPPDWDSFSTSNVASYFVADAGEQKSAQVLPAAINSQSGVLPVLKPQNAEGAIYPVVSPLEGRPAVSLAEVLRMDVTKEWVYSRWPRKSTGLANLNNFGVRVPLVTGTRITDLAGSLTYRFDAQGRVVRISFRGRTGDTTELVTLLVQKHQFTRQLSTITGSQLYQFRRGNDIISELRTQPAAVLWSSSPHNSFDVELELQRPNGNPLPPEPILVATQDKNQADAAQSTNSEQIADSEKSTSGETGVHEPASLQTRWNRLFPRSQMTPEQVEYLQRTRM